MKLYSKLIIIGLAFILSACCRKSATEQPITRHDNRTVDVTDFGAKGNGRNDDTKAIQKAIDFASEYDNSIVYFPKGTYVLSRINSRVYGCLELPSNIILQGDIDHTSILKLARNQAQATRMVLVRQEKNVVFRSLSFDGSAFYKEKGIVKRSQDEYYSVKGNKKRNEQLHSIFIKSSENVLIEDCHFSNSMGDGVYITGEYSNVNQPSNIKVRNSIFYSSDRNGITLGHGFKDVVVDSCIFYGDEIHTAMIDSEPVCRKGVSYVCSNVKITNNQFLASKSVKKSVDFAGSVINRNIHIENNLFDNIELHLVNTENATVVKNKFVRVMNSDINSLHIRYYNANLRVRDNTFISDNRLPLILVEGYSVNTKKADKTIKFPYPDQIDITKNRIELHANCIPFSLQTVKNVTISKNNIHQVEKGNYPCVQLKPNAPTIGIEEVQIRENNISNFDYIIEVGPKAKGSIKCISVVENVFDGLAVAENLAICQSSNAKDTRCMSNCYSQTKK